MKALEELRKQRNFKDREIAKMIQKLNYLHNQINDTWDYIEKEMKVSDEMTHIIELVEGVKESGTG